MKMKLSIVCLLLMALLGIIVFASIAQQNQNAPKADTEDEKLKIQFQTLENVKIELETKLAEANAKLINADFGKFERELRDSNNKWLWGWTGFFVGVVAIIGIAFWFSVRSLIADRVEKSLTGFQDAVKQVDILKNQLRVLRKEQAASMIEATFQPDFGSGLGFPRENEARREEALKEILEEALLDVFGDKKYHLGVRHKAAEILVQKSPPIVAPLFGLLNSAIDPDSDIISKIGKSPLRSSIAILSGIENLEVYDWLIKYLNRLMLLENTELKDVFLTWTVFSLTYIGIALDTDSSISIMKTAIPDLEIRGDVTQNIEDLVRYFDKFEEPEGIKEIYNIHAKGKMSDVEEKCLELLEKYDLDFVREQREEKKMANTKGEESNESESVE